MTVEVTDAEDRHRFEAFLDGKLAGFAEYIRRDNVIVLPHTEVEPEFEGHGVGGALARAALDDAAARGKPVRPLCPFIADWIARNPAYKHVAEADAAGSEDRA
ncbi:MAG TPA: GNAT family N-acetyltransferase [Streptosporangiaceae bacterium]|nr:GNAT family N-acetyltransferase [Streptosporangiaceae bacterium]